MYAIGNHTGDFSMNLGIDPALLELRSRAKGNELSYSFVMDCLKTYKSPRSKITQLLKTGALIRVKKGLYVFCQPLVKGQICKELLANLIFGPSYVSLEWALAFHGLIPERVEEVTSVNFKRKKDYATPLGRYSYFKIPVARYPVGVDIIELNHYQKFLMASKEKAICDFLTIRRGKFVSQKHLMEILFEDMRIDEDDIRDLNLGIIDEINKSHPHSSIGGLFKVVEKLK